MRPFRFLPWLLAAVLALLLGTPSTALAAEQRAPLGGGLTLHSGGDHRCTTSFAATDRWPGEWYLVAGGGCGRPGDTVRSGERVVGMVIAAETGITVIHVTNTTDWKLVPWISGPGGRLTLTGSAEAPIGASVCRTGSTTGWHCGVIQAKNQTIVYPDGRVHGVTRTSVCAEPGDGGAPFVHSDQAQGVLLGGSGNCAAGGSSYFVPVNPVLKRYGLILFTG
ncbi:S1 family peptidase [Amycolatopsis cihanbeyliensis]|uniref:Streptogrisin C n=1 Tax=Amycolatopsis cihanbeyliensis TaxID=1128664 RepID=A0A542DH33_AMYCI|nr:S1 family peptidase [Amycolatopsis cihanbeyliensis]TQJ02408.1 streptogrisin C [Amycolatopsis cihanbeyliensis]